MDWLPAAKGVRSNRLRGSITIEFLLSSLIWMPLLLGTIVFGINLVRAIQVSQLARDTGHMYAYGIDFSQPQSVALLTRMCAELGIQQNAGNGAVVLSTITLATQSDCDEANMKTCPNKDKYVFTNIYSFGNSAFFQTRLGNPDASYYSNGSSIQQATYLSDASLIATNFSSLLTFVADQSGQYAYVSEVTLDSQAINWSSFSKTGSYARSIF